MKLLSDQQDKILAQLKKKNSLSVDDLTSILRLAKTAVRRTLLSLEKRGLVVRSFHPSERGRPRLVFQLTSAAGRLFPSKDAELLSSLLKFLIDSGHEQIVDDFFENYWQQRFDAIQERLLKKRKDDFETRLEVLKDELEKEGFMPRSRVSRHGSQVSLQECHCPIEAAASITEKPCQLERRLISRVLNSPVGSATIRKEPHETCEFNLPIPPQNKKKLRPL